MSKVAAEVVLNAYLHQHIGLKLGSTDKQTQTATGHSVTHEILLGPTGTLHGGIIYTVCDAISFLSTMPHLRPGGSAATIN